MYIEYLKVSQLVSVISPMRLNLGSLCTTHDDTDDLVSMGLTSKVKDRAGNVSSSVVVSDYPACSHNLCTSGFCLVFMCFFSAAKFSLSQV